MKFMTRNNGFILGVSVLAGVLLISSSVDAIERRGGPRTPAMSPQVQEMIEAMLSEEQLSKAMEVLASQHAWGSLGPNPRGVPEPLPVHAPEREVDLMSLVSEVQGSGTADDPYVNVISEAMRTFEFPEPSSGTFRVREYSYPEAGAIEQYLSELDYEPTIVRVPAGRYREAQVVVPPGVWLKAADDGVVLESDFEAEENSPLVGLNIAAGLVGFELDGSNIPEFVVDPPHRITAVRVMHRGVVADNYIHHFPGAGISAAGSRARWGSEATVWNNILEWIGHVGIRGQSLWNIQHNQVRYAGVLQASSVGSDGILPGWGVRTVVANNLVIGSEMPRGRHTLSGQRPYQTLYAGNIAIAEGTFRNNIGVSDGANRNHFIGNLVLGTGHSERAGQRGISVSGYGNIVEFNAVLGNPRGIRTNATGSRAEFDELEDQPKNVIWGNYVEYTYAGDGDDGGIHRSTHYEARNNTLESHGGEEYVSTVQQVDPTDFGLFRHRE